MSTGATGILLVVLLPLVLGLLVAAVLVVVGRRTMRGKAERNRVRQEEELRRTGRLPSGALHRRWRARVARGESAVDGVLTVSEGWVTFVPLGRTTALWRVSVDDVRLGPGDADGPPGVLTLRGPGLGEAHLDVGTRTAALVHVMVHAGARVDPRLRPTGG